MKLALKTLLFGIASCFTVYLHGQFNQQPPEDFHPSFQVVTCFIQVDGQFLLLQYRPDATHRGLWVAPGGKVEIGETPRQAVIREVSEETGIRLNPKILKKTGRYFMRQKDHDYVLDAFAVDLPYVPDVTLSAEHSNWRWVSPMQALQMDLVPGGAQIIEHQYGIKAELRLQPNAAPEFIFP